MLALRGPDEPDPYRCPSCNADPRRVGIVEDEPVWMRYHRHYDEEGDWSPDEGESGDRVGSFDSQWMCGACRAPVSSPEAIEEEASDAEGTDPVLEPGQ